MALGIGVEAMAQARYRLVEADGGEAVLQGLPAAPVHVHVIAGHQGHPELVSELSEAGQLGVVCAAQEQLNPNPQGFREQAPQPLAICFPVQGFTWAGQPQGKASLQVAGFQVFAAEPVASLGGAAPSFADEGTQPSITGPIGGEQHAFEAAVEPKLAPENQFERVLTGGKVGADHSGERTLIGKGQGLITQLVGLLNQFLRVGCTPQKTEIAEAVEFGEPCRWRDRGVVIDSQ